MSSAASAFRGAKSGSRVYIPLLTPDEALESNGNGMSGLRLLLTSAGIRNAKIENALKELLGKKLTEARVVFIVTAAVAQGGDHGWLVEDINRVDRLGWKQLNILDLNGIPAELALARLSEADVIYATGGNAYHLARTVSTLGLAEDLLELLQRRVYVGASAGSMIFARSFTARMTALFGTDDELYKYHEGADYSPFNLFDWWLLPHTDVAALDSSRLAGLDFPIFAIDDETAVRVCGNDVDVVSEGRWILLDPMLRST